MKSSRRCGGMRSARGVAGVLFLINPLGSWLAVLRYFSLMQRKVILALLLLCSLGAWAGNKDKKSGPKKAASAEHPVPNDGIDYHQKGAPMPSLRVVTATGEVITNETIKNDANLFVMMFNPTCEHCEDMTRALEASVGLFKNSKIVLMAGAVMMPYLEYFDKTTH